MMLHSPTSTQEDVGHMSFVSHKKFRVCDLDLLLAILDGFQEWLFGFYFFHGLAIMCIFGGRGANIRNNPRRWTENLVILQSG